MIVLDENYTLKRYEYGWMLVYEHKGEINPETNKPTTTIKRTYHGMLEHAIKKYVDNVVSPAEDVQDLKRLLETVNRNILLLTQMLKVK